MPESAFWRGEVSPRKRGFFEAGSRRGFLESIHFPLWQYFNERNWRHGLSSAETSGCTASNRMPSISFLFHQNIVV